MRLASTNRSVAGRRAWALRAGAVSIAATATLALAACTGGWSGFGADAPSPTPTAASTPPVALELPAAPLTVIGGSPAEAAIATSAALFASSPVVVVSRDLGDLETSAAVAESLGVPLLVDDSPSRSASSTTSTSTSTSEPDAAPGAPPPTEAPDSSTALTDELDRLGATHVIVIDSAPPESGQESDHSSAPTRPDATEAVGTRDVVVVRGSDPSAAVAEATEQLPAFEVPAESSSALVLVTDSRSAASATARASGAKLVELPVDAPNPQGSSAAIEALSSADDAPALAIGAEFEASAALDWQVRTARTGAQLPGGGQLLFPSHMLVAAYGKPNAPVLGILGEQALDATLDRSAKLAKTYESFTERTVMPSLEIITTLASGSPTPDGDYSSEPEVSELRPWVEAAGAAGQYVVLDLQPGRDTFPSQLAEYRSLLEYPWVGVALDPEWRLSPGQQHLVDIGQVDAAEVNQVIDALAAICDEHDLPPKLLVLHQFRSDMLLNRDRIDVDRPEVSVLLHADGNGSQPAKQATWRNLHAGAPDVAWGWKNFIDEDSPMLTPEQTMREVSPAPDLVSYQ